MKKPGAGSFQLEPDGFSIHTLEIVKKLSNKEYKRIRDSIYQKCPKGEMYSDMQTINLKQYYPFCTEDTFVEVSDEIVEAFLLDKRAEAARERKMYRYKAFYSLDCDDGIENAAIGWAQPSPEDCLMEKEAQAEYAELLRRLYEAISSLTPAQARRVHARYMLGMKVKDIAAMEGITPSQAGKSIHAALRRLRRYFIRRKWTSGL